MPDWTPAIRERLASLRMNPAREAEVVEELSQHLDERYQELRAEGYPDSQATEIAIRELVDPQHIDEGLRPLRLANVATPVEPGVPRRSLPGDFWLDLRYALRLLRQQPGFAAAAILTLALGIGVNSAIFALVDVTLLRPLPLPDPDRLVMLLERSPTGSRDLVSPLNLIDWDERNRSFEIIAGFSPRVGGMVLAGADGTAETIPRQWVTAGFFEALGVRPVIGRLFREADDGAGSDLVVLTEGFWRSRFNADPGIIGRQIRLDGSPFTVVGVAPTEAQVTGRTSIWALLSIRGAPPRARRAFVLAAVGRLKPGATIDAARGDLGAIAEGLAREFPDINAGRGIILTPFHEAVIGGELRRTSVLFLGVVGFVLLICCANVANLMLARAASRSRELAIRSALGADRWRIVRQLLTESLLLAAIGGALGLGLGTAILQVAPVVIPEGLLPAAVTLTLDRRIVVFCGVAALVTGVLFGLAPAWQAADLTSPRALASGTRTTVGGGGRLRTALVAAEVATAVLLLFGAGLLLRTLVAVERVDRGYRAESVLSMVVDPLGSRYPTPESLLQFYESLEREVLAVPGVRSVGWATTLPLGTSYAGLRFFDILGDPPLPPGERPGADYQIVSPGYFRTLDLPIVAGRNFDARDTRESVPVCIVNEAFVRRHLGDRSPLGARVAIRSDAGNESKPDVREIVGVARQVKGRPDETEDFVQIYVPLAQMPVDDVFMVVRPASGPADALAASVRAAVARVDKEQLVSVRRIMTLEDVAREATSRHRFRAVLVGAFAALAIVLAMVGLSGILAYGVQQQTRDFGVRRALGAGTGDVLRPVVANALRVIGAGAAIGLALAAAGSRLLVSLLVGVEPLDGITIAFVAIVLALTALAATAGPAWRASRIDPAVALRVE